jgi:two-component system, LytTR family, sensor histidine kinase AlgZ
MKRGTAAYWRRILVGNLIAAVVVVVVFGGATLRSPPRLVMRNLLVSLLFSMCIGPMVGYVMPRLAPWLGRRIRFPFNWIAIGVVMTAFALVGSAAAIGVLIATGTIAPSRFGEWFEGSVRISIAMTLTIGFFITAYEFMRARVAQATTQAQLASLEARVQPHFLFNTLNSIAALIPDDPKGAERMTGQLAALLRTSLDQQARPTVPLEEELKTVRDYLAIEQVRFGDRLRFTIDMADEVKDAGVPRLAVQTIVENSVKYAVSPRREGATITIRAAFEPRGQMPRSTVITVEDDGPGFDASTLPAGHGLSLLRDRIALLVHELGSLQVVSAPAPAAGTKVTLTLPEMHDRPGTVVRRRLWANAPEESA